MAVCAYHVLAHDNVMLHLVRRDWGRVRVGDQFYSRCAAYTDVVTANWTPWCTG